MFDNSVSFFIYRIMLLTDSSICVYLRLSVDNFLDLFVGILGLFYLFLYQVLKFSFFCFRAVCFAISSKSRSQW